MESLATPCVPVINLSQTPFPLFHQQKIFVAKITIIPRGCGFIQVKTEMFHLEQLKTGFLKVKLSKIKRGLYFNTLSLLSISSPKSTSQLLFNSKAHLFGECVSFLFDVLQKHPGQKCLAHIW